MEQVKCLICNKKFTSEEALKHKEDTGHNSWELIMNWYKALWSRIGGRPWTYIWRDIYHTTPVIIQALWFGLGTFATWFLLSTERPLWWLAVVWGLYLFGFLQGHFHWGTKWQRGQEDK